VITEFFMSMSAGFLEFLAGLLPDWEPPAWMSDPFGPFVGVIGGLSSVSNWIDWVPVVGVVTTVVAVFVVTFGVKFIRTLVSHLPLIGGRG
jgi:hypothetical protein